MTDDNYIICSCALFAARCSELSGLERIFPFLVESNPSFRQAEQPLSGAGNRTD